jgi:hypothetical protein
VTLVLCFQSFHVPLVQGFGPSSHTLTLPRCP